MEMKRMSSCADGRGRRRGSARRTGVVTNLLVGPGAPSAGARHGHRSAPPRAGPAQPGPLSSTRRRACQHWTTARSSSASTGGASRRSSCLPASARQSGSGTATDTQLGERHGEFHKRVFHRFRTLVAAELVEVNLVSWRGDCAAAARLGVVHVEAAASRAEVDFVLRFLLGEVGVHARRSRRPRRPRPPLRSSLAWNLCRAGWGQPREECPAEGKQPSPAGARSGAARAPESSAGSPRRRGRTRWRAGSARRRGGAKGTRGGRRGRSGQAHPSLRSSRASGAGRRAE